MPENISLNKKIVPAMQGHAPVYLVASIPIIFLINLFHCSPIDKVTFAVAATAAVAAAAASKLAAAAAS